MSLISIIAIGSIILNAILLVKEVVGSKHRPYDYIVEVDKFHRNMDRLDINCDDVNEIMKSYNTLEELREANDKMEEALIKQML